MSSSGLKGPPNVYRLPLVPGPEAERVLGSTRWDWAPDLSPVGDRIVFVSDRSGSSELWIHGLGGDSSPRRVTELRGPYVNHPRWNPAGEEIAFDARPSGNADLYLLSDGARHLVRLTDHPGQDIAPI